MVARPVRYGPVRQKTNFPGNVHTDVMHENSSSSDSDAPPEELPSGAPEKWGRANKNRPSQLSTKKKVSPYRVAPGLSASTAKSRDPRFDPGAKVDEEAWKRNYDFITGMQKEEVALAKRKLEESARAAHRASQRGGGAKRRRTREKVLVPDEADALKLELERTANRLKQEEIFAKRERVKAEMRREEVAAVKEGKKPFFAKKSVIRERELLAQYDELRKAGKLEKFLEKRRRKNSSAQKRRLPRALDG